MRDKIKGRRLNWTEAGATRFPDFCEVAIVKSGYLNFVGSDGKNAGEILGHSERWSNRPLVSGLIDGKITTSIRVVN